MKKAAKLSVILLCILLCACSSKADKLKDNILKEYSGSSEYTVCADVTVDLGDNIFEYGVRYEGTSERGTLTVLTPESIAGLVIESDSVSGKTKIHYNGAELWAGDLDDNGLDPVSAIPLMLDRWKNGYVTETASEINGGEKYISLTHAVEDGVKLKTLFDPETYLPYSAEIVSSGKTVIFCSFKDVTIS